ncbi:integrase core domain-containing protein [Thalassolituus oleivorans]
MQRWMMGYNEERPHESLGDLTPVEYCAQRAASPEML